MATALNIYDTGDLVRLTGLLTSAAGALTDPTTLVATVTAPNGTVTTYTYGSDAFPIRVSAGTFYVDVTPTTPGVWAYRFQSTGTGQGTGEGRFQARMSRVGA